MARVSFGIENTEADVDHFLETLRAVAKKRPVAQTSAEFKQAVLAMQRRAAAAVYSAS